jgi:BASS family bile acid:Na+ symporter
MSVGLSLKLADFMHVFQRPMPILLGLVMSYGLVPLLAVWVGKCFVQDPALRAGLLLTACTSSNQLSNMYSQTARGDTALSVALTTLATVMGVWVTPLLCKALLGVQVYVDRGGILQSCAAVIVAPMLLGMLAKHYSPETAEKARPFTEVLGLVAASIVTASAVATCVRSNVFAFVAVAMLHALSALAGYRLPRLLGVSAAQSRSLSLTTALKSSAFGYVLSQQCCPAQPHVWAVCAVSVLWYALVGPLQARVLGWYAVQSPLTASVEESTSAPTRMHAERPWLPWVDLPIRDQPAAGL